MELFSRDFPALIAGLVAAGLLCPTPVSAQRARTSIPADSVIRLQLDEAINSRDATRGKTVRASLSEQDRSDFPRNTRFEGTITEVERAGRNRPATLDMQFRRATLPDGTRINLRGDLASLSDEDLRRTEDGRLQSRRSGGSGFDWKWVGIGAAGGAVLGEVLGDNLVRGGLLGGLGGAIYGYLNRDRGEEYREVELARGTEFGLRLNRSVAFSNQSDYRFFDRDRFSRERVAGSRNELRQEEDRIFLNDRELRTRDVRPMRVNGALFVPLRPLAQELGWTLRHLQDADDFLLTTPAGRARGTVGSANGTYRGDRPFTLRTEPMRIGGELYVPVEYLSRVGDLNVNWNRQARRLDLTSPR